MADDVDLVASISAIRVKNIHGSTNVLFRAVTLDLSRAHRFTHSANQDSLGREKKAVTAIYIRTVSGGI